MKAPSLEMKERQMLELLTGGASTRVIAKKMGYSEGTVRVYLHNLYRKLGVNNRTEALLWQLEHGRPASDRVLAPRPAVSEASRADETFGDVALRDGLLGALGLMESFAGPCGRVWEVGARLKGAPLDEVTLALRDEIRALWRALLQGHFAHAKALQEEGRLKRWIESSPSEAALAAALLLLGGYTHAADTCIAQLSKGKKGATAISGRELSLLRALRGALYSHEESSLPALHHLATERSSNVGAKHIATAVLFHVYRQRKDWARARETANVLWSEAEAGRRQLEAMGVRPLSREVSLPRAARGAHQLGMSSPPPPARASSKS
jgi:DNA-binding CsgD family transcriptional regulator